MKKVLIIDDSRLSVSALQNIVSSAGFNVVGTAFNGEEGIKKVKELNPDIVCLDFVMPDIDGKETAKRIREYRSNIKIIMITQKEIPESVKKEIKAISYVIKPFTSSKIKDAFSRIS